MELNKTSLIGPEWQMNLTWLGLMVLTLLGYLAAEEAAPASWILVLAAVKCILIAAIFIELLHTVWLFLLCLNVVFIGLSALLALL